MSNNKMHIIPDLFLTFARVGSMTFGGGYAMLPILQREVVEKKGWATEEQLADYYAIGQCTPGIIAVNTATFVGSSKAGIRGSIAATLGVVSAPCAIILIIAMFLSKFMDLPVIAHAFNGVRAGVTALILSSVIKLFKGAVKDWPTRIIYIVVLALAAAGTFLATPENLAAVLDFITSPVFLVLISGVAGVAVRTASGKLRQSEGDLPANTDNAKDSGDATATDDSCADACSCSSGDAAAADGKGGQDA